MRRFFDEFLRGVLCLTKFGCGGHPGYWIQFHQILALIGWTVLEEKTFKFGSISTQGFQRRILKCELRTDDRQTTDGRWMHRSFHSEHICNLNITYISNSFRVINSQMGFQIFSSKLQDADHFTFRVKFLITVMVFLDKNVNLPLCSIFSNSDHVVWSSDFSDIILELHTLVMIHTKQVWLKLAQQIQRKKIFEIVDGRRTPSDDKSSHGLFMPGELKKIHKNKTLTMSLYRSSGPLKEFPIGPNVNLDIITLWVKICSVNEDLPALQF